MLALTQEVMSRGCEIDIKFADRKLEKVCTEERDGQRRWGGNWKILKRRLASLEAAEVLADLNSAPGRCHALTADRAGQFALHLWEPFRLILQPADPLTALDPNGGIDPKRVTAILIVEIVDYHGS
jgi:plasmid maintenance system killer protein